MPAKGCKQCPTTRSLLPPAGAGGRLRRHQQPPPATADRHRSPTSPCSSTGTPTPTTSASTRPSTAASSARAGLAVTPRQPSRGVRSDQAGRRRPRRSGHLLRAGAVLRPAAARAGGGGGGDRAHRPQLDHRARRRTASPARPTCAARRSASTAATRPTPTSTPCFEARASTRPTCTRSTVGFNLVPALLSGQGGRDRRRLPEHRGRPAGGARAAPGGVPGRPSTACPATTSWWWWPTAIDCTRTPATRPRRAGSCGRWRRAPPTRRRIRRPRWR